MAHICTRSTGYLLLYELATGCFTTCIQYSTRTPYTGCIYTMYRDSGLYWLAHGKSYTVVHVQYSM